MLTVKKFMCHTDLVVGCIIIGLINGTLSCIFFIFTVLDIYYHNVKREKAGERRDAFDGELNSAKSCFLMNFMIFLGFVVLKAVLFTIYFLHFCYCMYLIFVALKVSNFKSLPRN